MRFTHFFTQLPIPLPEGVDTTKVETLTQKLDHLSHLSFQDLTQELIKGAVNLGIKIAVALIIFYVGRWLIRRFYNMFNKVLVKRDVDLSLRTFLLSLVNITLILLLIVMIIGVLGINTTSFVALFASAGVAIGMALSGTLQNFASGVMILLFKPFQVGDFIEAQGQSGTVKAIQIFNTVLNTPDNKTIIIPNGGLSNGIINNYSKEGRRRVDWQFGIAYGDDYDKAKQVISDLLGADKRISAEPAPFIALNSLGDSSVNLVVRAWVNAGDYWDVYFAMNEKVYKSFPQAGLNIPFPQLDVHLDRINDKQA